jgi:hypothetical protein
MGGRRSLSQAIPSSEPSRSTFHNSIQSRRTMSGGRRASLSGPTLSKPSLDSQAIINPTCQLALVFMTCGFRRLGRPRRSWRLVMGFMVFVTTIIGSMAAEF